MPQVNIFMPS